MRPLYSQYGSNIIYIVIIAKSGRTTEMKKILYERIADNISEATGHCKGDIIITLIENSEENWSFGNGKAQLVE